MEALFTGRKLIRRTINISLCTPHYDTNWIWFCYTNFYQIHSKVAHLILIGRTRQIISPDFIYFSPWSINLRYTCTDHQLSKRIILDWEDKFLYFRDICDVTRWTGIILTQLGLGRSLCATEIMIILRKTMSRPKSNLKWQHSWCISLFVLVDNSCFIIFKLIYNMYLCTQCIAYLTIRCTYLNNSDSLYDHTSRFPFSLMRQQLYFLIIINFHPSEISAGTYLSHSSLSDGPQQPHCRVVVLWTVKCRGKWKWRIRLKGLPLLLSRSY